MHFNVLYTAVQFANSFRKFPHDVLVDAQMMETLTTCGTRLEHIEVRRPSDSSASG